MIASKSLHTERFIRMVDRLKKQGTFKSYAKFCKTIGIWPQNFNQMKAGKREINLEALQAFAKIYNVDLSYILSGKGKAFSVSTEKKSPSINNVHPLIVTVDNSGMENIIMVESKAAAGYIKGYLQPEYFKKLPTFSLPGAQFRNGTFRCFQTAGDSMNQTIHNNDLVIGEHTENLKDIKCGDIYIVVSNEAIVIKRVSGINTKSHSLELSSDNPEYSPYLIKMEDIKEVWKAKVKISSDFSLPVLEQ